VIESQNKNGCLCKFYLKSKLSNKKSYLHYTRLKAGGSVFHADCNAQVFCPKPCKKFGADPLVVFEKKAKKMHFNSEK